jgi:hypothetical protein
MKKHEQRAIGDEGGWLETRFRDDNIDNKENMDNKSLNRRLDDTLTTNLGGMRSFLTQGSSS